MNINIDLDRKYDVTGVEIVNSAGNSWVEHVSPHLCLTGDDIVERIVAARRHMKKMDEAIKNMLAIVEQTQTKKGDN
jgi:hypothetical protein